MLHDFDYIQDVHLDAILPALRIQSPIDIWDKMSDALALHVPLSPRTLKAKINRAITNATQSLCFGEGLAALHVESSAFSKPYTALAILEKPVDMNAADDVEIVAAYLLLTPPQGTGLSLRRIARIVRVLRKPQLLDKLRAERCSIVALALLNGDRDPLAQAA